MPITFFDLDGPILDVSEKYYKTYSDILSQCGYEPIDKFLYWELKRNKTPEMEILRLSGAIGVTDYKSRRKNIIETDKYLSCDLVQKGAIESLQMARDHGLVVLVTLRSSKEQLLKQLKSLNLIDFFDNILVSGAETDPRWKIKYDLIVNQFGNLNTENLFIGDTETDILAGKNLGCYKTIGVLNGIRNFALLKEVSPDIILPSIQKLNKI
jgi:phosphoglycolate phosphatase